MGLIDNLGDFDPEKHALTRDYEIIPKSQIAGRKVIPDKTARALKSYVDRASAQQREALEAAYTKAKGGRLKAIAKFIESDSSGADPRIRDIFSAYKMQRHGPPPPPSADAAHATPPAPDSLIDRVNTLFAIQAPKGMSRADLSELISASMYGLIIRKEPLSESTIHKIARLAEETPDLFIKADTALTAHIIQTSKTLKEGSIRRITENNPSSGVYVGSHEGTSRIVIKPALEEYKTPYNPRGGFIIPGVGVSSAKGETGTPLRKGYLSGDAASRECAAYATDFLDGKYARTLPTLYIKLRHRHPMIREGTSINKTCAVQAFAEGRPVEKGDLPKISKADLEALAYTDIDEGNSDRHFSGNLFLRPDGRLQRIDQGLTRGTSPNECRLDWRQCRQLISPMLPQTKEKIAAQDISSRLHALESLGIPAKAIELEKARILLKKAAARAGLTFYDIAAILTAKKSEPGALCEFASLLTRSGDLEENINACVANVKQWKDHVANLYAADPSAAQKAVDEQAYPHLRSSMRAHILYLQGMKS